MKRRKNNMLQITGNHKRQAGYEWVSNGFARIYETISKNCLNIQSTRLNIFVDTLY